MERSNRISKLSWEETYKAMAKEQESWEIFEQVVWDGLEEVYSDSPLPEKGFIRKDSE